MDRPWACLECGARQAAAGPCEGCKRDDVSDLRDEKVRELARDIEYRLAHDREKRHRFLGAGIGMAVVFVLWFVPGYWSIQRGFALPFYLDQPLLMAGIGLAVMAVLSRTSKRKRFPYLDDNLNVTSG